MASTRVRFGLGCSKEASMDFVNMRLSDGGKGKMLVVTDETVEKLPVMEVVLGSFDRGGVH